MIRREGFTLIELSIVLVIIGLIAGGVLLGRDLIAAAQLRATVSQIEKLNTAVNTFRVKYGYLPGDIPSYIATRYGFYAVTTGVANTLGFGDGNTLIQGGTQGDVEPYQVGESVILWRHLSEAQMIDGSFSTTQSSLPLTTGGAVPGAMLATGDVAKVFPAAKLGRGNYIIVFAHTDAFNLSYNTNFYQITGIVEMSTDGAFNPGLALAMTPIEAQNIDAKRDDGQPLSGKTMACRSTDFANTLATAGSACVTATSIYDVGSTNGNTPNCQLRIKMN